MRVVLDTSVSSDADTSCVDFFNPVQVHRSLPHHLRRTHARTQRILSKFLARIFAWVHKASLCFA